MASGGASNGSVLNIIKGNLEARRAWKYNQLLGGTLVPILKPFRQIGQFFRTSPERALGQLPYWII